MDRANHGPPDRHSRLRRSHRQRQPDRRRRASGHVPGDGLALPRRVGGVGRRTPAAPQHPPPEPDRRRRGAVAAVPRDARRGRRHAGHRPDPPRQPARHSAHHQQPVLRPGLADPCRRRLRRALPGHRHRPAGQQPGGQPGGGAHRPGPAHRQPARPQPDRPPPRRMPLGDLRRAGLPAPPRHPAAPGGPGAAQLPDLLLLRPQSLAVRARRRADQRAGGWQSQRQRIHRAAGGRRRRCRDQPAAAVLGSPADP